MSSEPIRFFVHVPKCAGTTVERHFEAHLGEGEYALAPRWRSPLRHLIGNRATLPQAVREKGRMLSGHSLARSMAAQFPGRALKEYVLLRDPVGYHVSFYNYRLRRTKERGQPHPGSFETWLSAQRRSPIARFLLTRYFGVGYPALYRLSSAGRLAFLEARLAAFDFVGDYRRCDEALAGISAQMGIPGEVESRNVNEAGDLEGAVRAKDLAPALVARIEAEHAIDLALHARWKDRGFTPGLPGGAPKAELPEGDALSHLKWDLQSLLRKRL